MSTIRRHVIPWSLCLLIATTPGCERDPSASSAGSQQALPEVAGAALEGLARAHRIGGDGSFRLLRDEVGPAMIRHIHVQQTVSGVPVWGGQAIVHLSPDGRVRATTDDLQDAFDLDLQPSLDARQASALAEQAEGLVPDQAPEVDLWILRHEGQDHLVWRVQLRRMDAHPTLPVVFVDAHSGAVVFRYDNLQTEGVAGSGQAVYRGAVTLETWQGERGFTLEDVSRGLGLCTNTFKNRIARPSRMLDGDDDWSASVQANGVEVHSNLAAAYDYYLETFGRDGPDGEGGPGRAPSVTGSGLCLSAFADYDTGYVNAFWDGAALYFGDGDGYDSGPLVTLDIVGHELTHGVTQYTANLAYYAESGGLNESMSDIFGAMIERHVLGDDEEGLWKVGETCWTPGEDGDALRSMSNPAEDGLSLDYMAPAARRIDVHYSSGIPNLAFYLLAEGGSHPRLGGEAMAGIGPDEAAAIFYTALTSYMTSSTTFAGARVATLEAAEDLYGSDSAEVEAVGSAWALVGVDG